MQYLDLWQCPGTALYNRYIGWRSGLCFCRCFRWLAGQIASERIGIGNRGGQPDGTGRRGDHAQMGEVEGEQFPALVIGESMKLIEHDHAQMPEQLFAVGGGEHQREALRCRHQHMRRALQLAATAIGRGVTGAGLHPDRQAHFGDGQLQIALNIDRERLER